MALSTQPYKGARDFYPEDERLRRHVFATMSAAVERFGYEAYDAPILEPFDLYAAKSGEEIVSEQTYVFEDRGGRKVVIRPEMTPTVSRMVAARRQELPYPLRLYSIPNLWRYERPQRGRLREHWQLNVDIFGVAGLEAEHETILVADAIMKAFGATKDMYSIRVNSRKLVDALFTDFLKLDDVQALTLRRLLDRMHKMEYGEFAGQVEGVFHESQRQAGLSDKLFEILKADNIDSLPNELKSHSSVTDLQQLLSQLEASHITNAVFDISLMRGFDYYTDIVFEVFDTHPENNRAMFGGGRYDGLVGLFGVEPVPTVGFGMGDVTLVNFLEVHELLPKLAPETDVYVVLVGDVYAQAQETLQALRDMDVNIAVDIGGGKVDRQIKTAVKKGIKYALFIGEKELGSEQFTIKNLQTGDEETHGLQRIVSIVKDRRQG